MQRGGHVPQHFSPSLQSASDSHWARHGNNISGSSSGILSAAIDGQHPSCSFGQQYGLSYHEWSLHRPPAAKQVFSLFPHETSASGWPYTHGLHSQVGQPLRIMYRLHVTRQIPIGAHLIGSVMLILISTNECAVSMWNKTTNVRERRNINENCIVDDLVWISEIVHAGAVFICFFTFAMIYLFYQAKGERKIASHTHVSQCVGVIAWKNKSLTSSNYDK